MHALIFLGGEMALTPLPDANLIIAADRGWDNALKNGVTPDVLIGDMDSISQVPSHVEIFRSPCVKDETDTQLAVRYALEKGADNITLVGRLSGRADHTLSVIFLLEELKSRGIGARIIDDINRVRLIENETVRLTSGEFRYFGLLSLGKSQVSVSSCKYPLSGATLTRNHPYAVSNENSGDGAVICVSGDCVILTESERL